MRLTSNSIENGKPIAVEFAAGTPEGFAPNRNPHLAWSEVPAGTQSFALLCLDPDVPTVPDTVGRDDLQIPVEQPRTDFVHWAMADIPVDVHEIAAGSCSDGFVVKGKQQPAGPAGARQGLNSYTQWFAGNADMAGHYRGYDGPYPPFNDLRVHRYFFRVFALDVAKLSLPDSFTAADVLLAMQGHVLAEAALHGTYTLNPSLR
ncbi:YbhB/YbcL family Raf kinase inhibitor-like protein [Xanthomonas euvesicatoria pv. allii]|uniref:YbhB/YbcL family Raf kinase inhibitor-like protein n=1 Tax=Xanthomonas euvesicatoria TaxID=456327 RepID=UPI0024052DBD|nr:YbhB/YbcL family Raf kinase inhibitor-like protein [Xanthomonas euvesicatoria]MCP3040999.1 YbhB/YbcL family Raf kinase inhibitor-like protein [Xanthomonas euvesicatoria pv. allii]MCP3052892.1 YbhB/YbcL family Raf kinase inhibitor-like protein [Xanthomonas euvesicatoria pv. allii]